MENLVWLGIAALMAIAEAFSLTLVTIWFVIGGLVAFVVAQAGFGIEIQMIVFIAVSVISLLVFRPLALKHRVQGQQHEPSLIGHHGVVIETIDSSSMSGRVETGDHMSWSAISEDGSTIEVGTEVIITGQKSIKLIVKQSC